MFLQLSVLSCINVLQVLSVLIGHHSLDDNTKQNYVRYGPLVFLSLFRSVLKFTGV